MGGAVSTVARGVATFFSAPFQTLFDCGGACSGSGAWDVECFIKHLCAVSVARLLIFLVVCFLPLFFMWKMGGKCVVKSACKSARSACACCCRALCFSPCFICPSLWSVIKSSHRRRRRRRHGYDEEEGSWGESCYGSSSSDSDSEDEGFDRHGGRIGGRARRSSAAAKEWRRQERMRQALRQKRPSFKEKATSTARWSHVESRMIEMPSLRGHGEGRAAHGHGHGERRSHGKGHDHGHSRGGC